MSYIRVVNWEKYQHYHNRRPPWVKFYTELLHPSNKLNDLPVPTRFLFDRLLLLAAEYDNSVPNSCEFIASMLRMRPRDVSEGLAQLEKGKWISRTKTRRRASKGASKVATEISPQRQRTEAELEIKASTLRVEAVDGVRVLPDDVRAYRERLNGGGYLRETA